MFYKPRSKPKDLVILEQLDKRMNVAKEDKQHFNNLNKGYEGEVLFDRLVGKMHWNGYILNDLLLEVNHSTFQIDSLFLLQNTIYMFEIKNLEGDYYYESDKLYKKPNIEIVSPLHQLSRSESLLRKLLHQLGHHLTIHAAVVFIHPTFTLYQAPLNKPFIFPTQLKNYLHKLNELPSQRTERNKKLSDQLISLHMINSPFSKIPSYEYEQLEKGITCFKCQYFYSEIIRKKNFICSNCKWEEPVSDAVLRTVKEFQHLFPNEKITTNIIHDWCQVIPSKKRISKILLSNFEKLGKHRWTYYK